MATAPKMFNDGIRSLYSASKKWKKLEEARILGSRPNGHHEDTPISIQDTTSKPVLIGALYPSLDAVASSQLAFNAIIKSDVKTQEVNFTILSIYLYLILGYSGMVENGLGDEVPTRRYHKKSKSVSLTA